MFFWIRSVLTNILVGLVVCGCLFLITVLLWNWTHRIDYSQALRRSCVETVDSESPPDGAQSGDIRGHLERIGCSLNHVYRAGVLRYDLGFVEFGLDGKQLADYQRVAILQDIAAAKSAGERVYLITYVHGWRHNAFANDTNIRDFHLMLSHAKNIADQRCLPNCDRPYRIVGLAVGWGGAVATEVEGYGNFNAWQTFWEAKERSEAISGEVFSFLKSLERELDLSSDKMLTIGHSMGGNLIATAILNASGPDFEKDRARNESYSPLGTVVLLVNPASDFSTWNNLKERSEKVVHASSIQRPTYISMTSTFNWSYGELKSARKGLGEDVPDKIYELNFFSQVYQNLLNRKAEFENADEATGIIYPLGRWARLEFDPARSNTIGHFFPAISQYDVFKGRKDGYKPPLFKYSSVVGPTHEFVINNSPKIRLSFDTPKNGKSASCEKVSLKDRILADPKWQLDEFDLTAVPVFSSAVYQLRNQLSPRASYFSGSVKALKSANDFMWNIRVFNAFRRHNGFINFPSFCFVNQLVLDWE